MRTEAILILAAAAVGSSTGCGACFSSSYELVVGEAATLDEGEGSARSERDRSPLDPWDRSTGQMASSPCGDLALLWLDPDRADAPGSWGLFLRATDPGGTLDEVMLESGGGEPPEHAWSVAFDDRCAPVVAAQLGLAGWRIHRGDDGVFVSRDVSVDWSLVLGGEPDRVEHWTLLRDGGGAVRLFATAEDADGAHLVVGELSDSDAFVWEEAPLEPDWEPLSVAADPAGGLHLAYRQQGALRWGRWGGSAWVTELVEAPAGARVPAWGGASLALSSVGAPHLVATSAELDEGGAPVASALRHHNRQGSEAWASCSIVSSSGGGFVGAGGDCCSGRDPALVLDEEDRPHIVFNDVAAWEGEGGRQWSAGRLRYVFDNGRNWDDHVVVDQRADGELLDLRHPMIALGDGGAVHFAGAARSSSGASWDDLDAPYTLQTLHVRATRVLLP